MTNREHAAVFPDEVAILLASGEEEAAGEGLRAYAERLARVEPGRGIAWSEAAAATRIDQPLFGAYVRWSTGIVHHLTGEPARAEKDLADAAKLMSRCGRPDLADRASLLLIDCYGEQLRLDRARRLARRLERRFIERSDPERGAVALANLACAEDAADRVDRARVLWRRAIRRMEPGSLRHLLARANLANAAALAGRFSEAADEHREIAAAARGLGFDNLARHAELNLAETEFAMGRVETAFALWQHVIDAARTDGDVGMELVAEVDLATAETELGELGLAEARLDRSLPRLAQAGLLHDETRALRLRAVIEAARGRFDRSREIIARIGGAASPLQQDLLAVDMSLLDPAVEPRAIVQASRRLGIAGLRHRALLGLAWAAERHLERGDRRSAARLANEALADRRASAWVRLVAHHVLGRIGGPKASRHLFRAVHWADQLLGKLSATSDRSAFLTIREDVYLDLMAMLLERNTSRDRRRALDTLAKFRSGWFLDEMARRADRGDDPQVKRWQELRSRLAALLRRVEGQEEPRVRRVGVEIHHELRGVEDELMETEVALARRWPGLLPGVLGRPVSRSLMERLPEDELFVEYFLDARDLVVFTAWRGRLSTHRVRNAAPEIRSLAASVRFHMDTATWRQGASSRTSEEALRHRLRRLGELLLDPLPPTGWRALWVAPHAELYQLPWATLEADGHAPLIDRTIVTLVPGAGVAAALLHEEPRSPHRMAFGAAASTDLPMVGAEVRELARMLPGAVAVETTTRDDFIGMLSSYDLVHLAGHAVFLDGLPSASGLRLSDGYVTVHDLAATRIAASMVTFGVCSGVRMGADHVNHRFDGFLRSLLAGGVRSVVGAISPVMDDVAYAFDLELYRGIGELDNPGIAYQSAVHSLRRRDPNPAIWGNFHFFGDHRPWSVS
jgi:CHAT domain-containing protein/tetratricopeptide (TPR) repeat protein